MFEKPTYEDLEQRVKKLESEAFEHEQAEKSLQRSEMLHKEAQRVAHIGHWELDPKVGTPTWSDEIFRIFGLNPSENEPSFVGHETHVHPDDWPLLNKAVTLASTYGTSYDITFKIVRPGGEIRYMHSIGTARTDEKGHVTKVFGTAQDITSLRQVEEALRKSEKNLSSMLDNTQDTVVRIDKNFRNIFANPALYAATGLSPEQYLGKTNEETGMPEELCTFWREKHENAFRNEMPEIFEFTYLTVNKGERVFQAVVAPEFDENNVVETVVSFMRDITEIKNAESEKNAVIDKLEKALAQIKTLRGFLPICSNCKSIRDDEGYWLRIEKYIEDRSEAHFSHSICPKCAKELYPDLDIYDSSD